MLDERDRRALAAIERELSREDPAFATRMGRSGQDRPVPTVLALCVSLYVLLPMVTLLFGWAAAVIVVNLFVVLVVVVLIRRHRAGP